MPKTHSSDLRSLLVDHLCGDQCSVMATAIIAACLMTTRADEPMMLISIGMALFVVDHHRFIFNTRLITRESVWANKQTKQSIPWCSQICCTYPMECIIAYSWKAMQIDIIWGQSMIHVKDNLSFVSHWRLLLILRLLWLMMMIIDCDERLKRGISAQQWSRVD